LQIGIEVFDQYRNTGQRALFSVPAARRWANNALA
jgi:hypothetical protein